MDAMAEITKESGLQRKSLSLRINEIIKDNNLTQTSFGKMIGVSPQLVNNWLAWKSQPTTSSLKKISKVFGLSIDCLLGIEGQSKSKDKTENSAPQEEATAISSAGPQEPDFQKKLLKKMADLYATFHGRWLNLEKAAAYCDRSINNFNKEIRPLVPEDKNSRPVVFDREKLDQAMESRQIGNTPSNSFIKGGSRRGGSFRPF